MTSIRLPPKLADAIDKWARKNEVRGRSEAIRRLLDLGLKSKG